MPIIEVKAYSVGQQVFPTIQAAQIKELVDLICGEKTPSDSAQVTANWIVEHADQIVAILTCQPKTKKPRSDKGKKRTPKTEPTA